jgi:hypothetical protein
MATIAARRRIRDEWDELVAAGLCECRRPLKGHPPLPRPLPIGHGRPCSRPQSVATVGRPTAVMPPSWRTPGWVVDARKAGAA